MAASGAKDSISGKFHGTITPMTPSGWGITRLLEVGYTIRSILRFCGFIHFFRCLMLDLMSSSTMKNSANSVSKVERLP
jgi:hypothetical protein